MENLLIGGLKTLIHRRIKIIFKNFHKWFLSINKWTHTHPSKQFFLYLLNFFFAFCLLLVVKLLVVILVCLLLKQKSRSARGTSHHPAFMNNCPAISFIYLVDEFFIFSFLLLLKEVRSRGESKVSSCVWCKSRELGCWGSPRFPYVNQVVESFSSDLLWALMNYCAESHLDSCQTSTMELPWEKNHWL